jgi:transposase
MCRHVAVCAACPAPGTLRTLVAAFRQVLTTHVANALGQWLAAAEASDLRPLATGSRRDHDAVFVAILFRRSEGQVEGQVSRLELVKRMLYGRAGLPLLRRRMLAA